MTLQSPEYMSTPPKASLRFNPTRTACSMAAHIRRARSKDSASITRREEAFGFLVRPLAIVFFNFFK